MGNVVVTGANRGIGLALCRLLAARGERVIGVCREASDALRELGVEIIEDVDVAEPADTHRLGQRLAGRRLDWLLNNAGVLRSDGFGEIDGDTVADMLLQFRVNSVGPLLVTHALAPCLGRGSKVGIVSSRMGSIADNGSGGSYGYRMSKAAANAAGASLAHDLADKGVAVALLHPGYVRTGMTGGEGYVEPEEAAGGLIERMDALSMESTGHFWHANGEELPW